MKFEYAASTFILEFEREYRTITVNRKGRKLSLRSKYPYTTARLLETHLGVAPTVLYEATVGCVPTDPFSNAKGRIMALRALTVKIHSKDLRKALWEAYDKRAEPRK